jgi:hypothetical protein
VPRLRRIAAVARAGLPIGRRARTTVAREARSDRTPSWLGSGRYDEARSRARRTPAAPRGFRSLGGRRKKKTESRMRFSQDRPER